MREPSFWNRISASDPGFLRLQSSFRGLLAGLLAANLFYLVSVWREISFAHFFPGIYFTVLSSVFTNDADLRAQKITLAGSVLAACALFLAGTALSNSVVLMSLAFSLLIFLATYVRKFGPRWNTIGAICFTIFFLSLYTRTPWTQVPLALLTILVGSAITYIVRFWIVRSHPHRILQGMLDAFRTQLFELLDHQRLYQGNFDEERLKNRLGLAIEDLNEAALSLDENFARVGIVKENQSADTVQKCREIIFEIETRIELTAHATLEKIMNSRESLSAIQIDIDKQKPFIELAHEKLSLFVTALVSEGATLPLPIQGQAPQQNPKHALRLACQAGIASLSATVVGRFISAPHWYWTVISAYVVFVRTKSFADTNERAWQRVVGTLVGAALGLLIAEEAQLKYAGLAIMALAIFIAYYFIRPAYMIMVVFMTIFLAELYEVTGQFSFGVLALRVGLTIVGAFIGVVTARLVFPLKPSEQISGCLADTAQSMSEVRRLLETREPGKLDQFRSSLLLSVRDFDRNLRLTRNTAQAGRNRALQAKVAGVFAEGVGIRAETADRLRSFGSDLL